MGCGTSLDPDQTGAKLLEKPQNLAPPQLQANNHFACCINTVNLENTLRDIQTYRASIHIGRLPFWRLKQPPWHIAIPAVEPSTASLADVGGLIGNVRSASQSRNAQRRNRCPLSADCVDLVGVDRF